MVPLPLRVGVTDVEDVGVDLDWEHGLDIDFVHPERGVDFDPGRDRASPVLDTDCFLAFKASGQTEVLVVDMTVDGEPDDVLIPFRNGSESDSPLVETGTATRGHVGNEDCLLSLLLHIIQGLVEPVQLTAGVVSVLPQVEVKVVAGL